MVTKTIDLVSVVVPTFNRSHLVIETLKSIQLQTYINWELIVVDDGSTDNTVERIKEYSANDTRISIYQRNRLPKGPSTCKNFGAEKAKGKYIIFWDSDDIMLPWCLENRIEFIDKQSSLDFAFFQLIEFGEEENVFLPRINFLDKRSDVDKFLDFNHGGSTQTVIWRSTSFEKTGGWNEEMILWEDAEIHLRAIFKGLSFSHSKTPDGFLRNYHYPDRLTSDANAKEKIISALFFFEVIFPFLNTEQKIKFRKKVISKIWGRSFFLNFKEIKEIANLGLKKGLFTYTFFKKYYNYFFYYRFIKRIPLIRRPFYLSKSKSKPSVINGDSFDLLIEIKSKFLEIQPAKKQEFINILPDSLKIILNENK